MSYRLFYKRSTVRRFWFPMLFFLSKIVLAKKHANSLDFAILLKGYQVPRTYS